MKLLVLLLAVFVQDDPDKLTCVECHAESEEEHANSAHDRKRVTCESCHGTDEYDLKRRRNPHKRLKTFRGRFKFVAKFCGECHESETLFFSEGAHAEGLKWENPDTGRIERDCLVCHDDHSTRKASMIWLEARCIACHPVGDKDHDSVGVFSASFFALRSELAGVYSDIKAFPDAPELSSGGASRDADRVRASLEYLRQLQHAVHTEEFRVEAKKPTDRARAARAGLAAQVDSLGTRPFWLIPFVLIMVANMVLLRRWFVRRAEKSN